MNWTDCPIIEQIQGKVSGAPVIKHTRVRAEDLLANIEEGGDWLAEAYRLPLSIVGEVLAFYRQHREELPGEYISPERKQLCRVRLLFDHNTPAPLRRYLT